MFRVKKPKPKTFLDTQPNQIEQPNQCTSGTSGSAETCVCVCVCVTVCVGAKTFLHTNQTVKHTFVGQNNTIIFQLGPVFTVFTVF